MALKSFIIIIAFLQGALLSSAQSIQIKGRLVDDKGNPLVNVPVSLLKRQTSVPFAIGTETDSKGTFTISVPSKGTYFLQFAHNREKMESETFKAACVSCSLDCQTLIFNPTQHPDLKFKKSVRN